MADRLTFDYSADALREIVEALDDLPSTKKEAADISLNSAQRALATVKQKAPVYSGPDRPDVIPGALRDGLVLHMERNRPQAKQAFDIWPSPALNHVFQKPVLHPSPGKRKIAYYPASQNYGFSTPRGRRIPGKYFLEGTLDEQGPALRKEMIEETIEKIDKAWK